MKIADDLVHRVLIKCLVLEQSFRQSVEFGSVFAKSL